MRRRFGLPFKAEMKRRFITGRVEETNFKSVEYDHVFETVYLVSGSANRGW
jgi:hypothetical protein